MAGEPPYGYNPTNTGCTFKGCATQRTSTLDGVNGRRCADHAPRYERDRAALLADHRDVASAVAYLRTFQAAA